ncbi:MAG: AMP-binding protein [Actinobacteria bacterium]|nr:AMP-binding protein [Actinomycetota bacterium]
MSGPAGTDVSHLGPHHPARVAAQRPDEIALVLAGSTAGAPATDSMTWVSVVDASARLARALQRAGLEPGDAIALVSSNRLEMIVTAWAALRSGLYCTPVSTWLTADEAAYIVADCGARALVASADLAPLAGELARRHPLDLRVCVGGPIEGFDPWDVVLAAESGELLDHEVEGSMMLYSSGTTGRPKGVRRPPSCRPAGTANPLAVFAPYTGMGPDTVYLSSAPLYHAAPMGWSLGTMRAGGTVVVLPHFDPELVLSAIERYRVTLAQFVPTMLQRLVRLPAEVRDRYDRSSLRRVVHAAAPCPRHVKEAVIGWLGPIVDEYYSGTEGSGITYITSAEWLDHPGSVGRPILGDLHITDESGQLVPAGTEGIIWFAGNDTYEYHGDAGATMARRHEQGWTTLDDVGFVDGDGYLYLTDRRAHMIVSGGVNISPREIEDVLLQHPSVDDVAVIGVPDDEFGEAVKAVVSLVPDADRAAVVAELDAWCRERLARYKVPRSFGER